MGHIQRNQRQVLILAVWPVTSPVFWPWKGSTMLSHGRRHVVDSVNCCPWTAAALWSRHLKTMFSAGISRLTKAVHHLEKQPTHARRHWRPLDARSRPVCQCTWNQRHAWETRSHSRPFHFDYHLDGFLFLFGFFFDILWSDKDCGEGSLVRRLH